MIPPDDGGGMPHRRGPGSGCTARLRFFAWYPARSASVVTPGVWGSTRRWATGACAPRSPRRRHARWRRCRRRRGRRRRWRPTSSRRRGWSGRYPRAWVTHRARGGRSGPARPTRGRHGCRRSRMPYGGLIAKPLSDNVIAGFEQRPPRFSCRGRRVPSAACAARRVYRWTAARPRRRDRGAGVGRADLSEVLAGRGGRRRLASRRRPAPSSRPCRSRRGTRQRPMPVACGSTRPRTACAATSPSAAVPPSATTSHAARVARGFAVTTANDRVRTGVRPARYPVATSGAVEMSREDDPADAGAPACSDEGWAEDDGEWSCTHRARRPTASTTNTRRPREPPPPRQTRPAPPTVSVATVPAWGPTFRVGRRRGGAGGASRGR